MGVVGGDAGCALTRHVDTLELFDMCLIALGSLTRFWQARYECGRWVIPAAMVTRVCSHSLKGAGNLLNPLEEVSASRHAALSRDVWALNTGLGKTSAVRIEPSSPSLTANESHSSATEGGP